MIAFIQSPARAEREDERRNRKGPPDDGPKEAEQYHWRGIKAAFGEAVNTNCWSRNFIGVFTAQSPAASLILVAPLAVGPRHIGRQDPAALGQRLERRSHRRPSGLP